jgi:hypothetical protein
LFFRILTLIPIGCFSDSFDELPLLIPFNRAGAIKRAPPLCGGLLIPIEKKGSSTGACRPSAEVKRLKWVSWEAKRLHEDHGLRYKHYDTSTYSDST